MLDELLRCARCMTNDKEYESYKVLRTCLQIKLVIYADFLDESDNNFYDSLAGPEAYESENNSASNSAIDELEMIKIEDDSRGPCSICLEELLFAEQVTRMPCSPFPSFSCYYVHYYLAEQE